MRVEDLADMAGMSLSTFHRHFRTVTTMSPLQFQKHVRLQDARARLLAGGEGAAQAGFAVGYDSASQFSREYARQFGAPPARDAMRMRQGLVAAS
jgi:AraC-like DNA-binding protein